MSLFDSIWIRCPKCGISIEEQSKAGPCLGKEYYLYDAPTNIVGDLSNSTGVCPECGFEYRIKVTTIAQVVPNMELGDDYECC